MFAPTPAHEDLSITARPGESWADIPELAGYYQVSCRGRIKRLSGHRRNRKGFFKSLPEKIIKTTKTKSFNRFTGDTRTYLTVTLWLDEEPYHFGVGRLVYYAFVAPFDLKDKNLFIFYNDGDTLNLEPANLILGGQAEKQQRMEASGRRGTPFPDMTAEKRKAIQEKINAKRAKDTRYQISRYALSGKRLETYHNAEVAAKALNTNAGTLSKACRGTLLTVKGYLWRRGEVEAIDISDLAARPGIQRSPAVKYLRRVSRYDLCGNLLESYATIREAATVMRVPFNNISDVVCGKHLTCKGFLWRRGTRPKISLKALKKHPGYRYSPLSAQERKLSQYDLNGVWQKSYASVAEAVRQTGTDGKSIVLAMEGRSMTAGGWLWRSGTALRINLAELKKLPCYPNSALERHLKRKRELSRASGVQVYV